METPNLDMDALLAQIDQELQLLVLVRGELTDGSAHYAYASIPPSKYNAFKQAEAQGNYDLAQFGKILAHGQGENPPAEVQKQMEEEYGASHMFEEQLESLIKSGLNGDK